MKRTLCLFLALILAVGICFSAPVTITASAADAADIIVTIDTGDSVTLQDDDGDDYYDVGTADELYAFAAAVNGGNTSINGELTANITINENVLTADGELNDDDSNFRVWTPIGKGSNMYIGTFDGGDNTVSGLYYNDSEYNGVGLFGYVDSGGKVKNVGVIDSYISGNIAVGGVAGSIDGRVVVTNCYNTGTIVGKLYVGGVVGENFYDVNECYNTGIVKGGDVIGGVVGYSLNNTSDCYNTGTIKGDNYVGGVVGYNKNGHVKNCYNTSNVTATNACVGGVVGISNREVTNCYFNNENFTGDAIGDSEGGVANNVEPKTVEQFASGEVAYLLQQGVEDEAFDRRVWGQKIGEDAFPVFATESNKVYKNQTGGCNKATYTYEYSNIEKASVTTHTPDANGYTVGTDGTHSFKCSGCGTVITEPHNFENAAHQCACGERETYSITCTETGSNGGAIRLTNTEPAIHGQTYTTRLLMPQDIQGWYTDVIKVSVNGKELDKGTDYTYDLYTVTLTVNGEKVTGNIEITYQINAAVTFVLNGGDLEPTLKDRLALGGLNIIDDKITMPLAYGMPSSFNNLNNTFIREGYICTGLKNGEQDADMTAPVVNCTLSVQWQQCTHNTIDENDVCTTCGGNYCGADKNEDKVVWFFDEGTATLTITGSGAMATYGFGTPAPWSTFYTTIENVVIEKGVKNISDCAFSDYYSKIKSITLPDSVTSIGGAAFSGCTSLTSVVIPNNVTNIGSEAFERCTALTSVTIPKSVTEIGNNAFYGCTNILLFIDKNNINVQNYATDNNINYVVDGSGELEKLTFTPIYKEADNENSEITGYSVTARDKSISGALTIPSKYNGYSVTAIGVEAFYNCDALTSVTIPSSVKTIDKCAFFECVSLQTVDLTGVSSIGENAFCCCTALNSVVLGDDLKTIGFGAFADCNSLEAIELPEGLTTIDESAFSGCKRLKKVTIPKSVTKIGVGAFEVCTSLAEVEISEGVTTIGNRAFQYCESLTKIVIPKSVTSIDAEAFYNCGNLKYIFFEGTEDSQKTIGDALVTNAQIHYGSSTHTFNENYTVDVEPTCTEKGRESQHCKYCEETQYSKEIKENGHTPIKVGAQNVHTKCDVCEEILSATHNPTSKVTKEPTSTEEGVKTYTCECGYSYEEVIPCLVPGEIKAEDAESNSFSATVVDINSIVTKLQLTEEEKALIEQGADMKIVFKLSDIGATINTPEKEAIFKALTNEKIAVFLDIQLVKQIANNSVNVQKLNDLIKVTVELPSEFINKDGNVKRSYSVLRYHDGDETKVTTLNAKFDETTGTLTFETDRFSTYAIVYSDVVVSDGEGVPGTPDPGDGEVSTPENPKDETTPGTPETPKDDVSSDKTDDSVTNDKNDASSETGTNDKNDTSKDDVPKAGVISTTSIWLGAMALSGLGALLVSKKKKED